MAGLEAERRAQVRRLYDVGDKGVLRVITCGSVDDGKSTLIGRLLYDSKLILEDHLTALSRDSRKFGTAGDDIDFALLLDGLEAEREQGITIDVAYRFFATDRRKFIVADTPGHEQYTRNMATGASTADLAILLVDARKGVLPQTRRHSYIAHLLGIRHIVLAINKMDLVGHSSATYHQITADYLKTAEGLGFETTLAVPMSARHGDNVSFRSERMNWYEGPTLIERLEAVDAATDRHDHPFRFPVQWVNRPDLDFRGYAGTVTSGSVRSGDRIAVAKSGRTSRIRQIASADGALRAAVAGQAVTLVLEDEIDISRGDLIASPEARPEVSDQFAAKVIWMHEDPLLPGRSYLLKAGNQTTPASVTALRYKIDIESYEPQPAVKLDLNEIGLCNLETTHPIAFDPYAEMRETGSFILIDRFTNQTVGAGMIRHGLRRASNIHRQPLDVDKARRAGLKDQAPCILWFTGLSGAGKSTIANLVEAKLAALGRHSYLLDGDNVRHGLNKDLGFTDVDRVENIRRIGEVARLMVDAGLIVLCAFISPFRSERRMVRDMVAADEFVEIYVSTPLEIAEARDPKGLYKKARAGTLKNFTGIDSPYEPPDNPEITVDTSSDDAEALADRIVEHLLSRR